ncbi:MAG: tRNA (N6-isopentenyl adenosine(37)-C2)-methylthiotransferase MiaB [Candidatus Moranbacteria bacterium]|nr:tRNA (N6-isopentenyl adenosine(37)-C2)-methylthiotransferase MiaB [Candidatus Moranbacteria bacterium]
MKYFIKTFGCQMNVSDSERIATFLEEQGFSLTEKIQDADLVIFNTCGIKQTAENRAYSMINNLRKAELKAKSQKLKAIIMTGCLANRADVQKRMKTKVDLFCEIKNFPESVSCILYDVSHMNSKIQNICPKLILGMKYEIRNTKNILSKEKIDYLSINPKYQSAFSAYVPIMTGCNNFCSYCVVPNARGREVSRPAEEIITEVKDLIARGYKSITLLGQNVNSYHGTWSMKHGAKALTFTELLKKINAIPGKFWIQFVSSHPKDMSDELIENIAKLKKVCEWIHLPVQAGDDEILRRMNRKYTQKHYLARIRKIKSAFKKHKPAALFSISSDIIVGFPGETKKQFLQSATVMEKTKYDMVFFGQFSPRPETVAWGLKDDVSQAEKFRRENFLNEILKKTAFTNNKKYVGKKMEVIIEKEKNGSYFGKTRTQKNVKVESKKKDLLGKIIKVQITKANIWNLEAKLN